MGRGLPVMHQADSAFGAANTLLRQGDIDGCVAELQSALRKDASDNALRVFLAQVYCLNGAWAKASRQLKALAELDAGNIPFARTCETAIACEAERSEVFSGQQAPTALGEPEPWFASLIHSNKLLSDGRLSEAADLRAEAMASTELFSGTVNGEAFEWLVDLDSRMGPVFEMFINGRYYWVPFSRVHRVEIETPTNLQEFVWLPLKVTWSNNGTAFALMPVRYPGSESHTDQTVVLGHATRWEEPAADTFLGAGQRMFGSESSDVALLDIRELVLDTLPARDSSTQPIQE